MQGHTSSSKIKYMQILCRCKTLSELQLRMYNRLATCLKTKLLKMISNIIFQLFLIQAKLILSVQYKTFVHSTGNEQTNKQTHNCFGTSQVKFQIILLGCMRAGLQLCRVQYSQLLFPSMDNQMKETLSFAQCTRKSSMKKQREVKKKNFCKD